MHTLPGRDQDVAINFYRFCRQLLASILPCLAVKLLRRRYVGAHFCQPVRPQTVRPSDCQICYRMQDSNFQFLVLNVPCAIWCRMQNSIFQILILCVPRAGLVSDASRCLICNASGTEAAHKRLEELHQQLQRDFGTAGKPPAPMQKSVQDSALVPAPSR